MRRKKDQLPEAASFELATDFPDRVVHRLDHLYNLLGPTVALAQQVQAALFTEVVLIVPRGVGNVIKFYGYDVIVADVDFPYVGVRSRT